MVKGVSKTIIEVNNTGSRLFEKIVFYVTPEYSTLSAKQLKKAANSFSFNYNLPQGKPTLRKKYRRKTMLRIFAVSTILLVGLITVLAVLL